MADEDKITSTGGVTPLFAKHKDLGLTDEEQISVFHFCKELCASDVVKRDDIEGAQRVRGLWRIYLNNNGAKAKLLAQDFVFRGKTVILYEQNPFLLRDENNDPDRRHVKVTIQNLPLSVSNSEIEAMIKRCGGKIEKALDYEYERDDDNHLTTLKNGNRHVLVNEDIKNNPLPRNTFVGNWRCRVFHYGQKKPERRCFNCLQEGHLRHQCKNDRACRACKVIGHREGTEDCEYYQPNDCEPFQGAGDELSNFYPCAMVWQDKNMHCSEMAYGCELSTFHARDDIKNDIMRTSEAFEVKTLMKRIHKNDKWGDECDVKMKKIIKAKADQVPKVKDKLMRTGDKILAEAVVSDTYWSCGLSKEAAAYTEPANWPGQNKLGKLWMEVREEYKEEENKKKKEFKVIGKNGKPVKTDPTKPPAAGSGNKDRKRLASGSPGGYVSSKPRKNNTTPDNVQSGYKKK